MLEKPEKKFGSKLSLQKLLWDFQILGDVAGFEAYYRVSGPVGPKNGPKPQRKAKKRVLGITLARGGVTSRTTPPVPCSMGVPAVLEGLKTPTDRF